MARTRLVLIINRTTKPLDCMFDGSPDVVPPGYREERSMRPKLGKNNAPILDKETNPVMEEHVTIVGTGPNGAPGSYAVEYYAAEAYKRQHPRMGTADPYSVDQNDMDYLIGVEGWGDDISHVEQSNAIELIDTSLLADDRRIGRTVVNVAGGRRLPAGDITQRKINANKKRHALGEAIANPYGMDLRQFARG